ncbi:FAD-dependent oxidoreductase [Ramlibacter rhizophilus]|uniref:FAD-dependent oxidoreductase n=1 Tax=Ramlibacter rhizophilus TaxID=1781167 RepID=A0A4Z0BUB8_9BURK|nr:FAD-dependent oxidoreductase [Ramlibacter rhizophilus]TFZ01605.1 FAD-dependent oxidoreductase [Ramlibacter rhizophilus]
MNIAIVGAGVVGVTTAYELALRGHAVSVFERRGGVAEASSFAGGGLIAPGCLAPGAPMGASARTLRSFLEPHPAPLLRWPFGWRELAWRRDWRRANAGTGWHERRQAMQQLAEVSRVRLHELTLALELDYDRSPGLLVLLRSARERRQFAAVRAQWDAMGVRHEEVSPEEARTIEPALDARARFVSALHLPDEGVANSREVAQLLRRQAQQLGVQFNFDCAVLPLERGEPRRLQLQRGDGGAGSHRFDAVVLCTGVQGAELLRPLGLRLPIAPLWGYSVTARIGEPLNAPASAVFDERHKVLITRLGDRVRVSGGAELGGRPDERDPRVIESLYRVLQEWFPAAARLAGKCVTVQEWKGARPMLPDGAPVLGPSGLPGLWLNLGHGACGWALAFGCAGRLAQAIDGQGDDDFGPLGATRWWGR